MSSKELAEMIAALPKDEYVMFQKELSRLCGKELLTAEIIVKNDNFKKN
jgi:hypothetical protein